METNSIVRNFYKSVKEKYPGEPNSSTDNLLERLSWLVNDNTITEEVKFKILVESILTDVRKDIFNKLNSLFYRNHAEKSLAFMRKVFEADYIPPILKIELLKKTPCVFMA